MIESKGFIFSIIFSSKLVYKRILKRKKEQKMDQQRDQPPSVNPKGDSIGWSTAVDGCWDRLTLVVLCPLMSSSYLLNIHLEKLPRGVVKEIMLERILLVTNFSRNRERCRKLSLWKRCHLVLSFFLSLIGSSCAFRIFIRTGWQDLIWSCIWFS